MPKVVKKKKRGFLEGEKYQKFDNCLGSITTEEHGDDGDRYLRLLEMLVVFFSWWFGDVGNVVSVGDVG